MVDQHWGGKLRRNGHAFAVGEHTLIAAFAKCGSRQIRGSGQTLAAFEHGGIATWSQRRGGQFRSRSQVLAAIEHLVVTRMLQGGGRQYQGFCRMAINGRVVLEQFTESVLRSYL